MFNRWKSDIGQLLAPDAHFEEKDETSERAKISGGFWNWIAPDPNFASPASNHDGEAVDSNVQLPVPTTDTGLQSGNNTFSTPRKNVGLNQKPSFLSPSSSRLKVEPKVERLVLDAAKDLTQSMLSPPNVWKDSKIFIDYCASTTQLNEKKLKKVRKMLSKDPSLANARASNMGNAAPNGFTPLHAAASVGNYAVALILIDFALEEKEESPGHEWEETNIKVVYPVDLDARDVQGRTALHIASLQGHVEVVQLLKKKMKERFGVEPWGENAPTDLTGRTPLGWAATSRAPKARANITAIRNELFSPGDRSVYGENTPAFERTGSCTGTRIHQRPMDLTFGSSDMPGHRIDMEDAICSAYPLLTRDKSNLFGFFGVFDGHGDGGIASEFVAENIIPYFTSTNEWVDYGGDISGLETALIQACSVADIELKKKLSKGNSVRHGGSTGVMAVIAAESIMIGNVGDSRCLLVQKCEDNLSEPDLSETTKELARLSMKNETDVSLKDLNEKKSSKIIVKALSYDHKPNLDNEKARIEKAGMKVEDETFTIDGETITISKICKSDTDRIAVSRAFGDFDYKDNSDLKECEQAIISVPEIIIHKRDFSRDLFLILACDGVYDVMSNDDVGEFVMKKVTELKNTDDTSAMLPIVGDLLLEECLNLGSTDNMSVLIVALPKCDGRQDEDATKTLDFADV